MKKVTIRHLPRVCSFLFLLFWSSGLTAQAPIDQKLEAAVASLRNIDVEKLSDEQRKLKAEQVDASWKVLTAGGQKAAGRLKKEIEKIVATKEKDDFFKLNASVVLWNIGKFDEADYISKIWTTTPISTQYTYVFMTAFDAAQTQDLRVLPMLKAVLKDDKGSMHVGLHAMNIAWPLSHEFIWGSYGPKGLSVLAEILEKSNDEVELRSAMDLLARSQYLPALPRMRQLAASENDQVRLKAIQSLGIFGHPSDYDRLIAGLNSNDTKELFSYAFALYEFEDERAVKHLIPLLDKNDDQLRVETSLALLHLLTPESLAAVKGFTARATNPEVKKFLTRSITLREDKLPEGFAKLTTSKQTAALRKIKNAELMPNNVDGPFTKERLLVALRVWREKGRIYDSGVEWVGEGNLIAAATPENLDSILETKAAFYRRLSDECLYEVRDLDTVVKYIGRGRYRKGIGVTEKAEPK